MNRENNNNMDMMANVREANSVNASIHRASSLGHIVDDCALRRFHQTCLNAVFKAINAWVDVNYIQTSDW